MRCAFKARDKAWIDDCDIVPVPGTELRHVGKTYWVADVQWWFGGLGDELALTDVLVTLRAAYGLREV
ncbi:MAG TPA: hypothetical protein VHV77_01310 [Pirellulales bacterium]|jgi:hypothetical protein|nr:hypothetical protein [Pirellulales bacterium]